jgi:hypothetical protein
MTDPTTVRDPEIQELLDRQAIRDTFMRYCRGVDRSDASLINSAFHPDAIDEHGTSRFTGEEVGAQIANFLRNNAKLSMHNVTNQIITIDGDTAGCETYFAVWQLEVLGEEELIFQALGRYIDRFERRNGEWKIAHRVIVTEFAHYLRPAECLLRPNIVLGLGRRDPTDPSYAVIGG